MRLRKLACSCCRSRRAGKLTDAPEPDFNDTKENSMGRMLALAGILSALCYSGFAQSKERPSAGAEQAVMRIERELLNAVLKGDPSANERYLADTYVFTGPDGTVENKTQAIADLKSGD